MDPQNSAAFLRPDVGLRAVEQTIGVSGREQIGLEAPNARSRGRAVDVLEQVVALEVSRTRPIFVDRRGKGTPLAV